MPKLKSKQPEEQQNLKTENQTGGQEQENAGRSLVNSGNKNTSGGWGKTVITGMYAIAAVGLMAFQGCDKAAVDRAAHPKNERPAAFKVEKQPTIEQLNKRSDELRNQAGWEARKKRGLDAAERMLESGRKARGEETETFIDLETNLPKSGIPQWWKLARDTNTPQEKLEKAMEDRLLNLLDARKRGESGLNYGLGNPEAERKIFEEKEFPILKDTLGDERIKMIQNSIR